MIVDNTETIKQFLPFSDTAWYYLVEIIQRRKDRELKDKDRIICRIMIHSEEEYVDAINNIKDICNATHARSYILLNPVIYSQMNEYILRNAEAYKNGEFDTEIGAASMMSNGSYYVNSHFYTLLDIDPDIFCLKEELNKYLPENGSPIILKVPTVNGEHWIIPYMEDLIKFKNKFLNVGVHHECRTLLYACVEK